MKIRLERCVGYLSPGSQARSPLTSASPVTRDKPGGRGDCSRSIFVVVARLLRTSSWKQAWQMCLFSRRAEGWS
jgi:hypothetical protein